LGSYKHFLTCFFDWNIVDFFLHGINLALVITAACAALGLLWMSLSNRGVSRLSTSAASLLINAKAQVVDVRDVALFAAGHIAGSKSLPFAMINEQLPLLKLKKDKPVLLICERGVTAAKAAAIFTKNDFTQVHVLEQGLTAWRDAQLPLIK
jgi:rhodanese-related sulfurtransferase